MGNVKPLGLGGGQIRADGRFVGEVMDCYVEKAVSKLQNQTNFGLERRTNHVVALTTSFNIGCTFKYIDPSNMNFMNAFPGYSAVPHDRSLPGDRKDLGLISYGINRYTYTEYPKLTYDEDNKGVWTPLLYPVVSASASALDSPIITMDNQDFTGTASGWYSYVVLIQNVGASTTQSLPSNMAFVPFNNATPGHEALLLTIKQPDGATYLNTDTIQIYRAVVLRDSVTGEFDFYAGGSGAGYQLLEGTAVGTDTGWDQVAIGSPASVGIWTIDGDNTSGTFFGVDLYGDTALGGTPTNLPATAIPIKVYTFDVDHAPSSPQKTQKTWPIDYVYEQNKNCGGALKLTKNSTIPHGTLVQVDYTYDSNQLAEVPLSGSGRNPIIPITFEILFPDNLSKMIWHFYKVQVNSDFRFTANEDSWIGVDFAGQTLDASDIYPKYGFGYMQYSGPIVDLIKRFGNHPYGTTKELSTNQTDYA